MHQIAPWQVWKTNFDPQVGREQAGYRPAIIVGTSLACNLPNDLVIVVPCTTKDRGLSFHPPIQLTTTSYAMCDQIKSISRSRLVKLLQERPTEQEINDIAFVLRRMIHI